MEISKVTEVFFSPTYSTERIVRLIGEAWEETHQEIDLSRIPKEREIHEFGAQDLVIFGVPSYGGRVPAPAAERFRNLKGQKGFHLKNLNFCCKNIFRFQRDRSVSGQTEAKTEHVICGSL